MSKFIVLILIVLSLYKGYPYYNDYMSERAADSARQTLQAEGVPQPDHKDFIDSIPYKEVVVDNGYPISTTTITFLGHTKEDFRSSALKDLFRIQEQEACHSANTYYENKQLSDNSLKGYGRAFSEDKAAIRIILKDEDGAEVFSKTTTLATDCITLRFTLKIVE